MTIPFEQSYQYQEPSVDDRETFEFCGCGWPSNMLIPRGNTAGLECELFVMVTNNAEDRVDDEGTGSCNGAFAYCGVKDAKYPDSKPMGFPFDRRSRVIKNGIATLDDFMTPNMKMQDVLIVFRNKNTRCPENSVQLPTDGSA